MTIGDVVKRYRKENGISMDEFAKRSTLSKGYISMLENNINPRSKKAIAPTLPSVKKVATAMGMELDELLSIVDKDQKVSLAQKTTTLPSYPNIQPISTQTLPMLGEIACGTPIYMNEDRESYVLDGTEIDADFCLTARGDSMINARIHDGDIVFIRKQDMVENGEIAAVGIGDEATLKRVYYYREQAMLILRAENPEYKDQVYTKEQLDDIHILGKAIAFQSDVK